jgi:hypothetical protein
MFQTPVFYMNAQKKNTAVQVPVTQRFGFLKKIKRDHLIFFLCVLIAGLFWFMIKLSDVYRVTYLFRVEYNHVPVDKRLTRLVDSTLTVDVTARGFALLDMGFGRKDVPLAIDLRNYQLISDKGNEYYIFTQELRNRLADDLHVDESNIILSENRLAFVLEELSHKQVPVVAKYQVNFKDQFGAYLKSRLTPDHIEVYGPASALDTLSRLYTGNIVLNDVDSDIHVTLRVQNPAPDLLSFNVNSVVLEEDVERFTESSFLLPVNVSIKAPHIKTFPSSVKVFFKVAQKDYNKVQPSQFNVTIDAKETDLMQAKKLHLILDRSPSNVSNIRIVPADVEFLILK